MARGKHFWESMEPAAQRRFFRMTLLAVAVLFVSAWAGLDYMARAERKAIAKSRDEYSRVVGLVNEIQVLRAGLGDLSSLPPEEAVRAVMAGFDKLPPALVVELEDGAVEVSFPGIPLFELTAFLTDVRDRANLQARLFEVGASSHGKGLAHSRMVLTR